MLDEERSFAWIYNIHKFTLMCCPPGVPTVTMGGPFPQ